MDTEIKSDFIKFLINEEGNLVGVFSAGTLPVSNTMEEAININFKN
jgi:glutathione peroxidase-family protein